MIMTVCFAISSHARRYRSAPHHRSPMNLRSLRSWPLIVPARATACSIWRAAVGRSSVLRPERPACHRHRSDACDAEGARVRTAEKRAGKTSRGIVVTRFSVSRFITSRIFGIDSLRCWRSRRWPKIPYWGVCRLSGSRKISAFQISRLPYGLEQHMRQSLAISL